MVALATTELRNASSGSTNRPSLSLFRVGLWGLFTLASVACAPDVDGSSYETKRLSPQLLRLPELEEDEAFTSDNNLYIAPNERNIESLAGLLEEVAPGALYVSVGSERAYFGALITQADLLLVLDWSQDTSRFHRLNLGLLAAAADLEEYRSLRLEGDYESMSATYSRLGLPYSEEEFGWWSARVRDPSDADWAYMYRQGEFAGAPSFGVRNYLLSRSPFALSGSWRRKNEFAPTGSISSCLDISSALSKPFEVDVCPSGFWIFRTPSPWAS